MAQHRKKWSPDREKTLILGLVLGFGSFFGLIFGFLAGWDSGLTGLLGFGIILGALSFMLLLDKHMQNHNTMPEVSLSTLLLLQNLKTF